VADLTDRMRSDWDLRAREDARYYAAFGRRGQEEAEFQQSAGDVVRNLDRELRRLPPGTDRSTLHALEIGCGPGRLMLPMSLRFGKIHGVDISEEMIRLARERLASTPNARVQVNSGADLDAFADEWFDFVYSYAVFQHIPSLDIVFGYLRETHRVLKAGGLLRCQINGLPKSAAGQDTWQGVRVSAAEIREFAFTNDFQLLALEGAGTQYMWVTLAKRPTGWRAGLPRRRQPSRAAVRRLTNVFGTEPLATTRGRFAAISLWIEALPPEFDLLQLEASIGGLSASPFYIGPVENDGLSQVNVALPAGIENGLQPVQLEALGEPLCPPVILRVVPPGPAIPRVVDLSDAVDLLSGPTIRSGIVKLLLEDVERIAEFRASFDGQAISRFETVCVDPGPMRYEINIHLPAGSPPGRNRLELGLGGRKLGDFALLLV
jgi:SAM-dependent methyltransferase